MAADASAGYSGTPLPRKLGIKEGASVALLREPDGFRETLGELPDGVSVTTRASVPWNSPAGGNLDVVVAFFTRRVELEKRLPALMDTMDVDGALWISWPKRSAGVETDITEDTLREVGLPLGMVDNKVCAIDETWSGLRLVYRRENRDAIRAERSRARARS
jgi:ABC-type Na+ transport system ATPase subunit NatA